jgi:hypothetical protein
MQHQPVVAQLHKAALRQIGNAVPVLLAQQLGHAAMTFLKEENRPSPTKPMKKTLLKTVANP